MKKSKKIIILLIFVCLLTGCTKTLKDKDNKAVINETTGQNLTENILCRPTEEETIKLYEDNGVDLDKLPYCSCKTKKIEKEVEVEQEDGTVITETKKVDCESFKINSGKYEGLWTTFFVKPLAYVILFFGRITKNYGLGLIITSLIIRLIAYPVTRKTAMQSEYMKKAQPELERLEKKYSNKDQNDKEVMMQKSQEMMMLYKKYNISPFSSCLLSFIQLPLFLAFLQAINRIPVVFEDSLFGMYLGMTPYTGLKTGNYIYIILIILIFLTTYFSFKKTLTSTGNKEQDQSMKTMFYMMLIMIVFTSFSLSTAISLYWIATNGFIVIQNYIIKLILANNPKKKDNKDKRKKKVSLKEKSERRR